MTISGFGEVAEQLRRSTVVIHAGGSGSGVIWSADGTIVTNAHVARRSQLGVHLWDGRELGARIVSRNPQRDIAVLRVNANNLPAAIAADSSQVRPGELAIAIGNRLVLSERSRPERFTASGRSVVSARTRGYRPISGSHQVILVVHSRTPEVELSGSTR